MKHFILFSFLLIPSLFFAQTNYVVVEGKVRDIMHKPIAYATVQSIGTVDGANANITGHYSFRTTLPATLKASFVGYKTVLKKIVPEVGKDTIKIDFVMEVDSAQLKQVEVTAIHEPELIKESGSLLDFETNQHKVWLLYNYRKGDHLEVYDSGMNYLTRMILNHRSDNINRTRFSYLYIENSDSLRLFNYIPKNNSIHVGLINPDAFHQFIDNLSTYHNPYYYYFWAGADSSVVKYWYFKKQDSLHKVLYYYKSSIVARHNDSLISELKHLHGLLNPVERDTLEINPSITPAAMSQTGETGGSGYADIKNPKAPANSRAIEDQSRPLEMMLLSFYCPLRIIRDSIYIFNFDNDSIYVYNFNNVQIRKMLLSFSVHGVKYKNQDILVNEEGNECYFKYVINGTNYLQKIDLNIGNTIDTEKIGLKFSIFLEKIRIMAGYAYYTCSDSKDNGMFVRHLYKQKLN